MQPTQTQPYASVVRAPAPTALDAAGGMEPPAHKWVLIVDDEEDILQSVSTLVSVTGNGSKPQIRTARSADDAIGLLRDHSFDMILCDFHLGGTDGVTVLETARQMKPGIRCLLMTGDPHGALDRLASSAVADIAILSKPFPPALLVSHVTQGLGWPPAA